MRPLRPRAAIVPGSREREPTLSRGILDAPLHLQVLAIAAVTMSSSLSAEDDGVGLLLDSLRAVVALELALTIMVDLRAPATAQGPAGPGRTAAGCE